KKASMLEERFSSEALSTRVADLTRSSEVEALFAESEKGKDGWQSVIHLVGGFRYGRLVDLSDEDWQYLVDLNLGTTFRVLRAAERCFEVAKGGSFVAVSAPAANLGESSLGGYAATKAGVLRLVEAAAREMRLFGARANTVLPGTMDTPGNRRAMPTADPAEWVSTTAVSAVIEFLTSRAASAVNGAAVFVPGPTL
ncbi:MAG TPA: SDR family oxidoreductase, partial [Thermoanaerobaculia bacterium]|nr:SDR family oxidoreductase [Thermoanaerobaculia bacterium]